MLTVDNRNRQEMLWEVAMNSYARPCGLIRVDFTGSNAIGTAPKSPSVAPVRLHRRRQRQAATLVSVSRAASVHSRRPPDTTEPEHEQDHRQEHLARATSVPPVDQEAASQFLLQKLQPSLEMRQGA